MLDNANWYRRHDGFKQALIAAAICVVVASCAGPIQPPTQQITAHDIAWCRAHVAKHDVNACVHDVSQQQVQPPWPEPLPWPATPSARCITQQYGIWFSTPCRY